MFLQIYNGSLDPEITGRASAREIERAISRIRATTPGRRRFVTTRERDLLPSQVAVLAAIADHQEAEFLAALETGVINQP